MKMKFKIEVNVIKSANKYVCIEIQDKKNAKYDLKSAYVDGFSTFIYSEFLNFYREVY